MYICRITFLPSYHIFGHFSFKPWAVTSPSTHSGNKKSWCQPWILVSWLLLSVNQQNRLILPQKYSSATASLFYLQICYLNSGSSLGLSGLLQRIPNNFPEDFSPPANWLNESLLRWQRENWFYQLI